MKTFSTLAAVSLLVFTAADALAVNKRIYHIGNSVTDTINYAGLGGIATGMGDSYTFGRHMIPGAPLAWIYSRGLDSNNDGIANDPSGFQEAPFGYYNTALANFQWEAVTLQPFDRQLGTPTGALDAFPNVSGSSDLPIIRSYVNILRSNPANANTKVYIYSRWPRRANNTAPLDFPAQWNRTYTGGWDGTNESKDYFEKVTVGTRQIMTNLGAANQVNMVPVGDVLLELDRRIKLGQVPGYTDITQFYADGVHLTNVGGYVTGLTFYATIYGKDPRGQPVPAQYLNAGYGGSAPIPIPPALVPVLQDIVWSVVNGHPYSGVNVVVPEPASLSAFTGMTLLALRRVRRQR
jgi:hypothetical protein